MPKSYLSREPGAQRATQHAFDPFRQTLGRLRAYRNNGHRTDKVELIVLGGTWSSYPEPYQIWFVKRCFDALNVFPGAATDADPAAARKGCDFLDLEAEVDGARTGAGEYNAIVGEHLRGQHAGRLVGDHERAAWEDLEQAHRANELAATRCVGLSLETRPDHVDRAEVRRLRRLGATKVQVGLQSLQDDVLAKNARGHDVACTRRAMHLLRGAGFKLQAHWMPNLYGSDPVRDVADVRRLFDEADFRPDELKIYPCSLLPSAELMRRYHDGTFRPYTESEVLHVVAEAMRAVPEYCRITRVFRDIPSTDIHAGIRSNNLRETVERRLRDRGERCRDIRARQIRRALGSDESFRPVSLRYRTSVGEEVFLQSLSSQDELIGFLRLSLPTTPADCDEIRGAALIREVHVYGAVASYGERDPAKSQHFGVGKELIARAEWLAREAGHASIAVISAIGTREYYRSLGYVRGDLYQYKPLAAAREPAPSC
jgi:elongator complex protein 3